MGYAQSLQKRFPSLTFQVEDLLLLEDFQVKYFPDRVPEREFSILLRAYPMVHRFLELKYPPIASFNNKILSDHNPVDNKDIVEESCQDMLWEIADLIIYNKYPEVYDEQSGLIWEISELSSITSLQGKTIVDAGAGTGRLAFLVAPFAETVFALEPVQHAPLCQGKGSQDKCKNFAIDGFGINPTSHNR